LFYIYKDLVQFSSEWKLTVIKIDAISSLMSSWPEYLPSVDKLISISRIGIRDIEPENIYFVLNNLAVAFTAVEVHGSLSFFSVWSVKGGWPLTRLRLTDPDILYDYVYLNAIVVAS
jgi:hypothetical protein